MTRIIGGVLGSLRLKGPAKATRPTSDRVKESIFSRLESLEAIAGAKVLDLYAGTGALGIEAASRGAIAVTLIERDLSAIEVCKANLRKAEQSLQLIGNNCNFKLEARDAKKYLAQSQTNYDLVFLDPPYDLSKWQVEEVLLMLTARLNRGALVVVERGSRLADFDHPKTLRMLNEARYGDTAVFLLTAPPK